jgi:hypothetical protein
MLAGFFALVEGAGSEIYGIEIIPPSLAPFHPFFITLGLTGFDRFMEAKQASGV